MNFKFKLQFLNKSDLRISTEETHVEMIKIKHFET